jgi:hypothetical protein
MLHYDPLLDRSNHRLQRLKPRRQHDKARRAAYGRRSSSGSLAKFTAIRVA